ncbi:MAG: hypothetical protein ACU83U_16060, partial [Gammaproteobacteria bacterium]
RRDKLLFIWRMKAKRLLKLIEFAKLKESMKCYPSAETSTENVYIRQIRMCSFSQRHDIIDLTITNFA